MKNMSRIKDKLREYNFFDPFPSTNYFAFIPRKSNEDRLVEAVVTLNLCSKDALRVLHDKLVCDYGSQAIDNHLEHYYKIFIENENDFTKCLSGWDQQTIAKCERSVKDGFDSHTNWHRGIGTEQQDREEAERRLIRAIAAR